jgi:hypothetical protein
LHASTKTPGEDKEPGHVSKAWRLQDLAFNFDVFDILIMIQSISIKKSTKPMKSEGAKDQT